MKLGRCEIMKKTVLTLSLLAGVYGTNMNALYAVDPGEGTSKSPLSSAVFRGVQHEVKGKVASNVSSAGVSPTMKKTAAVQNEVVKNSMTREEAINTLTYYGSVALAGVASVAYMIAQPSHSFAVLVPWVAYSIPTMVVSVAQMCEKAYSDRLERFKKAAFDVAVEAGVPARFQRSIADNLMGRSESYREKFVELYTSVKREGLNDYQNYSLAFAISTLREDRLGLVSEILKCFEDNGDVFSWYNLVEDAANSIRHRSPKGVCVHNESAVEFIKAIPAQKTN